MRAQGFECRDLLFLNSGMLVVLDFFGLGAAYPSPEKVNLLKYEGVVLAPKG